VFVDKLPNHEHSTTITTIRR